MQYSKLHIIVYNNYYVQRHAAYQHDLASESDQQQTMCAQRILVHDSGNSYGDYIHCHR